jgi:hypothetical protein
VEGVRLTPAARTIAKRRWRSAAVIVVVVTMWVSTVQLLAVAAFVTGFTLPEAGPLSAADKVKSGTLILVLVVFLVLPPTAGAVVGVRHHRPVLASFCGLIAVAGLAAAIFLVPWGLDDLGWKSTPAVTQVPLPDHCVERSGGDTRCPGG